MVQRLVKSRSIPGSKIESLIDSPRFQAPDGGKWSGYYHHIDPTILPFNVLTYPSVNCTIPSFDKVVPDLGKTLLGQVYTENSGIIGNKERFTSLAGIEMEVRVNASLSATKKDIIEIYFENNRLMTGAVTGTFQLGETVTGATSNANGTITNILNYVLTLDNIIGNFTLGEVITGSVSGAFANVLCPPVSEWHQITEDTNPLPRGLHEYYFDEWFDTKQPNTIPASVIGKNLQRLIWVNGYFNTGTKKGAIYSWTGGIALITTVSPTTIVIDASTTWRSLGFTENSAGAVNIIVNGVSYAVPVAADLDTSTLNVVSTTGITVGDFAFSKIEIDDSPSNMPFDMCRQYHGYMYYGNWNQKKLYQSNGFNREYNYLLTFFQALNNDISINMASPYTDIASQHVYHIVVDSINPAPTFFTGSGSNALTFDISGYTLNGTVNTYKVVVTLISNSVQADHNSIEYDVTSIALGSFIQGEIVLGSASGHTQTVRWDDQEGSLLTVHHPGNNMTPGETITGSISGSTATVLADRVDPNSYRLWSYWVYKNSVLVGVGSQLTNPAGQPNVGPFAVADGITFNIPTDIIGNLTPFGGIDNFLFVDGSLKSGDTWEITVGHNSSDTFKWQRDGGTLSASIPMTSATLTALSDGVQIKWQVKNGHQVGDFWDITAYPKVERAFANFYYANNRLVGEGYIYNLPTNFWTMDTQEEELYLNGTYGDWNIVKTEITSVSVENTSETIGITPLKQTGANKVLYPYLTGHMNNELVYVTKDKTLDMMSRLIAVEKPQISLLSDPVKLDFEECSFIGGRIKYHKKRLYISSPQDGITHCYDFFKSYWQPPKMFPEVGLLSIIGDDLVCHSNTRNQSFTMFTNSDGDNGSDYNVEIRTPYTSRDARWQSKYSGMSFVDGYITGNPRLIHTVYLEPNGCGGIFPHTISPVICKAPDRAPFGEGSFGCHPFGSDKAMEGDYFKELNKAYAPRMEWYLMALGISCTAKAHTWSILTLGMNTITAPSGNQRFINPSNLPEA